MRPTLDNLGMWLSASCCILALGATVGLARAEDAPETESDPNRCMLTRNIEHYRVIDGNWIVIADRREETFLLGHIQPRCWDLRSSFRIAVDTPRISVCAGEMLDLLVEEDRCHVVSLEAVSSYEEAEALVAERQSAD